MKHNNKTICSIIVLLLLCLCPVIAMAQNNRPEHRRQGPGPRFSPEEYAQLCDTFVTTEAGLTTAEAQKFFPIYHQMKDEQRKVYEQIGQTYRNAGKNDLNEKEANEALAQVNILSKKLITIEENYQKKFLKVITASKLIKVKLAEKRFERRALGNAMNRNPKDKKIREGK